MTFKVGDKVRVIGQDEGITDDDGYSLDEDYVGKVGVIESIDDSAMPYSVDFGVSDTLVFTANEIEVIEA